MWPVAVHSCSLLRHGFSCFSCKMLGWPGARGPNTSLSLSECVGVNRHRKEHPGWATRGSRRAGPLMRWSQPPWRRHLYLTELNQGCRDQGTLTAGRAEAAAC